MLMEGGGGLCSPQAKLIVRTVMGMVLITVMMTSMPRCEAIGIIVIHGRVPRKRLSLRTPTSNKCYNLNVDVDGDCTKTNSSAATDMESVSTYCELSWYCYGERKHLLC